MWYSHIFYSTLMWDDHRREHVQGKTRPSSRHLDLIVLRTLVAMGPMHGYGIARRIEQVSGNQVLLNQGTIYASLVRLQQRGLISTRWGTSGSGRQAKYYSITRSGRKRLAAETENWERLSAVIGRLLATPEEGR